jgi:hypothetical protein
MADLIERTFLRLDQRLSGRLSKPGDARYAGAIAIWAKPVGPIPRAIAISRSRYVAAATTGLVARCATAS